VTRQQVVDAANRAADDVIDAIGAPGTRDVANLVVNAALYYLDHPAATLREAVAAEYNGAPFDEVIAWCSE
jgi:hypothetical protein